MVVGEDTGTSIDELNRPGVIVFDEVKKQTERKEALEIFFSWTSCCGLALSD